MLHEELSLSKDSIERDVMCAAPPANSLQTLKGLQEAFQPLACSIKSSLGLRNFPLPHDKRPSGALSG